MLMHTMQCMQDRYHPSSKILLHPLKPDISILLDRLKTVMKYFHLFKMVFKSLPSSVTANSVEKRVKYCNHTWLGMI